MKLTFRCNVKEALKLGINPEIVLDFDPALLTDEERKFLAARLDHNDEIWLRLPAASVDGLREAIRKVLDDRAAEEAAKIAKLEEKIRKILANPESVWCVAFINSEGIVEARQRQYRSEDYAIEVELPKLTSDYWVTPAELQLVSEDLRRQFEDMIAEAERRRAELLESARPQIKAKEERRKAASEAKKAALEANRKERAAWIESNGSPRLKRLVKEGIEHDAVYRDERLAIDRPGWTFAKDDIDTSEPRNAPESALDLLDAARKTAPDATLIYWIKDGDFDEELGEYTDHETGYAARSEFLDRTILHFGE